MYERNQEADEKQVYRIDVPRIGVATSFTMYIIRRLS